MISNFLVMKLFLQMKLLKPIEWIFRLIKGLSAGAIVVIVLAIFSVVAAVIVALLLLKTGSKAPMKADKISIPNSFDEY